MKIDFTRLKHFSIWILTGCVVANFSSAQTAAIDYPDISLDPIESTSGWRSHNTVTLDTEEFKRGTASLKSVGSGKDRFRKKFTTPIDVSNMRYLTFWYYVDNPKKLGGSNKGQIEIGSAGTYDTEEQNWSVYEQHFHKGWNYVVLDLPGAHRSKTNVRTDLTRINWFRIYHDPTATITTRIDDIRFTNRDPRSRSFSQLLKAKRLSKDIMQADYLDSLYLLLYETNVDDPKRQKFCRQLQVEQAHWEVSRYSLEKMGIDSTVARNDVLGKKRLMELVCGPGNVQPDIVLQLLQQGNGYEVALNRAIMGLYDVSQESAAEIRNRILELDLNRIMGICQADADEIDEFISEGITPRGMLGANVLFRNCDGSVNEIALQLGSRDALIDNRVANFRQCMKDFTDQASQCGNPYMNPDDEYNQKIDEFPMSDEDKKYWKDYMAGTIQLFREMSVSLANAFVSQDLAQGITDGSYINPTYPSSSNLPNYDQQVTLHQEYDTARARALVVSMFERRATTDPYFIASPANVIPGINQAITDRFVEERWIQEEAAREAQEKICRNDPENNICEYGPPPPPDDSPPPPFEPIERCAEMDIGDGYAVFYNNAPGGGFSRQMNEGDRIDHCLCDLFDKSYAGLPQFELAGGAGVSSFCPDPMERVKHECTQPGWADGPPSPECVLQGLVSDQLREDELPTRVCWAMRSEDCPNPALDDNGDCSCFQTSSGPVDISPLYDRCANALRCANGSAPTYLDDLRGCGCAPLDPVGNVCANNLLTRTEPVINYFPGVNALAGRPVVSLERNEPLVTRTVSSDELDGNQLRFSVFNAFDTSPVGGQAEARCTNLNSGVSNYLIDRVPVTNLTAGSAREVGFTFSDTDMEQCFGGQGQNSAYLELGVRTANDIPRMGYVADYTLEDILGPVLPEQPCVPIVNGPRPTPWNLSSGEVIRTDIPTLFPTISSDGTVSLPHTIIKPVVFTKDYAPSSLDLFDNSSAPAVSTLNVTRQGPTGMLTLHLHLRGNWLAGRFLITLTAPDGTEVHEVFGLGVPEEGEAEEEYDGGIILRLDELDYTIDSEGPWTLEVRDLGGSESGRKSGDLYSWSLNFNAVEAWDEAR